MILGTCHLNLELRLQHFDSEPKHTFVSIWEVGAACKVLNGIIHVPYGETVDMELSHGWRDEQKGLFITWLGTIATSY